MLSMHTGSVINIGTMPTLWLFNMFMFTLQYNAIQKTFSKFLVRCSALNHSLSNLYQIRFPIAVEFGSMLLIL